MKKKLFILVLFIVCLLSLGCHKENQENNNISLESLVNEEGLLFTISASINCIPVELRFYNDTRYELYDTYKVPKDEANPNQNLKLIYSEPTITGTSNYNILKIIENSKKQEKVLTYEIRTGQGEIYTTDASNQYLMEFLDSINVNLDVCATKDYT